MDPGSPPTSRLVLWRMFPSPRYDQHSFGLTLCFVAVTWSAAQHDSQVSLLNCRLSNRC